MQILIIPTYNEDKTIFSLIENIRCFYKNNILIVNDGSTDNTLGIISKIKDSKIKAISHKSNIGYGASLIRGFRYAIENQYNHAVTFDADGQHAPSLIPDFFSNLEYADIVSGSRYLDASKMLSKVPQDRLNINKEMTLLINKHTGYKLTDAFCGFKAYKVSTLQRLSLCENGYAFPIQCWIQASKNNLTVKEYPVPNIYLDYTRSFTNDINDPSVRLAYYKNILLKSLREKVGE